MSEKKFKSKDEWKELINKLSETEFQDLCFEILKKNNFQNIKPRGKGSDGGRDIEAEFIQPMGKERITQKIWAQAKRYGKTPLNYRSFSTEATKANNEGIDRFIVMSNKDMTSDAKDDISKWNKINKCQISDWSGSLFLDMLFESPNLCKVYFPDEDIPLLVDILKPQGVIRMSENLGNRFGIEIKINTKGININNPEETARVIKEALSNLKTDINIKALIYEKISLLFFAIGKSDDAIAFLNKSLDITPKNINAMLTKGYILERIDQIEDSNRVYDDIFDIEDNNPLALNNKAHNLLRQGDLEESLKLINRALEISPNLIIAIKNKIKILKSLKREDEALEILSKNQSAFEKSTDLLLENIDICIEKLDLKKALNLNKELISREPENISALNNLGVIYERNARYQFQEKYHKLALESFEKVIQKEENYPLGWSNKTVILMNTLRLRDADEILEQAYSRFPSSPEIINKKGELLLRKKEPRKAIKYFDSALKKFYRGEFILNRATASFQLNHYPEALKDIERLLKNEPKNSRAWAVKSECLKRLRKPFWKEALENAQKFQEKPISLLEESKE